eukprot:1180828-Prorocentrum_minimum.AAC.5
MMRVPPVTIVMALGPYYLRYFFSLNPYSHHTEAISVVVDITSRRPLLLVEVSKTETARGKTTNRFVGMRRLLIGACSSLAVLAIVLSYSALYSHWGASYWGFITTSTTSSLLACQFHPDHAATQQLESRNRRVRDVFAPPREEVGDRNESISIDGSRGEEGADKAARAPSSFVNTRADWPLYVHTHQQKIWSSRGQDGSLAYIFSNIGLRNSPGYFVEFGFASHDKFNGSNTYNLKSAYVVPRLTIIYTTHTQQSSTHVSSDFNG